MKKSPYIGLLFLAFLFIVVTGGTWTTNQFGYKPNPGARGATEKSVFDAGLERIDTRLGKEIWVGDPAYGPALQPAIAAIGSNHAILRVPPGTHNIAADLLIPANISVKVERGAILSIATSKTLTINGSLEAGRYQIFSCAGTGKVVFGSGLTLYPDWWGCVGDGSTNDFPPMQACFSALPAGGVCDIGAKSFAVGTKNLRLPCRNGWTLRGVSPAVSKFIFTYSNANDNPDGIDVYNVDFTGTLYNITVENIHFTGSDSSHGPTDLLNFSEHINTLTVRNCEFSYCGTDTVTEGGVNGLNISWSYNINNVTVRDCHFHDIGTVGAVHHGVGMTGSKGVGLTVDNCTFENISQAAIQGAGIDLDLSTGGTDVRITNCRFNGVQSGLTLYSSTPGTIQRVVVSGNIFNGNKQNYFGGMKSGAITGNTFYGSSIAISGSYALNFSDNVFYGNYSGQNVMDIDYSGDCAIRGNTFKALTNNIYIHGSAANVTFINNDVATTSGRCLNIYTTGAGINILGNLFASAEDHGMKVENCGGGSVCGNSVIVASGKNGFYTTMADPSPVIYRGNKKVGGLGGVVFNGLTNFPLVGTATFAGAATKVVTLPGWVAATDYQVIVTGGNGETFWVTSKSVTGFTINSSNASSSASVDYVVNVN